MLARPRTPHSTPTIRIDKKLAAAKSIMDWAQVSQLPVVDLAGGVLGMITRESISAAVPDAEVLPSAEWVRRLAITPVSSAIVVMAAE